jgi:hypothetical protein
MYPSIVPYDQKSAIFIGIAVREADKIGQRHLSVLTEGMIYRQHQWVIPSTSAVVLARLLELQAT